MEVPEEVRQSLKANDAQTLEARARRMAEVGQSSYDGVHTPTLEHLRELDKLYVNGHFMATVVFAGTILEHWLRQKLYTLADIDRVDRAGLGTLCTMARRTKILQKSEADQVRLVNKMRNTIVTADIEFAQWLIGEANPEIDDPYVQMIWFFSGFQLSLMASICANIARSLVVTC